MVSSRPNTMRKILSTYGENEVSLASSFDMLTVYTDQGPNSFASRAWLAAALGLEFGDDVEEAADDLAQDVLIAMSRVLVGGHLAQLVIDRHRIGCIGRGPGDVELHRFDDGPETRSLARNDGRTADEASRPQCVG